MNYYKTNRILRFIEIVFWALAVLFVIGLLVYLVMDAIEPIEPQTMLYYELIRGI